MKADRKMTRLRTWIVIGADMFFNDLFTHASSTLDMCWGQVCVLSFSKWEQLVSVAWILALAVYRQASAGDMPTPWSPNPNTTPKVEGFAALERITILKMELRRRERTEARRNTAWRLCEV